MNGAIAKGVCESRVHEPVLLEEREPVEARARDGHLEVVAAARPVLDDEFGRVGKGGSQQALESGHGHRDPWSHARVSA
jgi:hypothetical protein